ncbi:MAG: IS481 family transposase [Candidatus Pacebacteria bacterium]|jgi:transposase InsO family protein|nr:IS481 family transposase [Candidatus Paceibacterota bacterium]
MKTMPNSTQEEKSRWIKPILEGEITIKDMAKVCPFSERALKYWLALYRSYGIEGLRNRSTRPKTHPKETPIRIKERILELRKEKKRCALKLGWELEDEGIKIHHRTIGKILKAEGLTRRYRTRKINWKYVRIPFKRGELVEIDVKFVPDKIEGKKYYQFTAIDCASRWRYLQAYENADNVSAISFLKELINAADFKIQAIKTDNGSCFTNRYTGYNKSTDPLNPRLHAFDVLCNELKIPHYLIDPGKPQQNAFVERSHREDQEKFYEQTHFKSFEELKYKLRIWNTEYNNTKHCGLNGKTPNQALRL